MIKLCFNVSYVIHANSHIKNANCGLQVNFANFLLISFCFMMKMDHFRQKFVLCPQVHFKYLTLFYLLTYSFF